MKKLISLTALLSLFIASQASAISYYSDVDDIYQKVSKNNAYHGEFNIVDNGGDSLLDILAVVHSVAGDGYDAATETVIDAWAFFVLKDDRRDRSDKKEKFKVKLGSELFAKGKLSYFEIVAGNVGLSGILDLDEDGILNYKVSSKRGDFKLLHAGILAKTTARAVSDSGTTLALLGLGMLGLVAVRRRSSK